MGHPSMAWHGRAQGQGKRWCTEPPHSSTALRVRKPAGLQHGRKIVQSRTVTPRCKRETMVGDRALSPQAVWSVTSVRLPSALSTAKMFDHRYSYGAWLFLTSFSPFRVCLTLTLCFEEHGTADAIKDEQVMRIEKPRMRKHDDEPGR